MRKVYIVAAKRTAIGKLMGGLTALQPGEMGARVIKAVLADAGVQPEQVDQVIVGNVLCAGQKQGVARQAAILAGIPAEVPAYGVNMICGSGMKSVLNGYTDIVAGNCEIVLAGGTESMSNAGFVMPGTLRSGNKMGNIQAVDHMVCDGLTDAFHNYHMGITAENIAEKYGITLIRMVAHRLL